MTVNGLVMQLKRYIVSMSPIRRRAEIDAKARALIDEHGDEAYYVARALSRDLGQRGRREPEWHAVSRRIAKLTGHVIGVTGADRYPGP